MKLINYSGIRGSGKTKSLIEGANFLYNSGHNVIVLTIREEQEAQYRIMGLNKHIDCVPVHSYRASLFRGCEILIDNAEQMLGELLGNNHISVITCERENIIYVEDENENT